MRRHLIYILLFWILGVAAEPLPFRLLPSINMLPTDEVHCLYRDRQGLLWIGTSTGLKSYNGYDVHTYKSDAITPSLLPNNNILCITEDRLNHLWLGTGNGLVRMDQRTGEFRTYNLPLNNQRTIYTLTTGHDGIIWIGTDGGLTRLDPNTGQMITFNKKNTRMTDSHGKHIAMHDYSVKGILDDGHGHLFVGTWYDGLLRLDLKRRTFVKYPWASAATAAYSLFMDSRQRLWVGTWGGGMMRLDHPYDAANPGVTHYPYIPRYFDTYYKIKEDPTTHTLLACSRDGISLLRPTSRGAMAALYHSRRQDAELLQRHPRGAARRRVDRHGIRRHRPCHHAAVAVPQPRAQQLQPPVGRRRAVAHHQRRPPLLDGPAPLRTGLL